MIKVLCKLLLIVGFIVYLGFALTRWNKEDSSRMCRTVSIQVNDSAQAGFITQDEVTRILKAKKLYPENKKMDFVDTYNIERVLKQNPFIEDVTCFKTAGDEVRISISQRLPLMRVMVDNGDNYFLDQKGSIMPRMHYAANLVMATGNITKSYARRHLYKLGRLLQQDEFLDSQIEQICVDSAGHVELVPRVGDHLIYIGEPVSLETKLSHLKTFYEKVLNEVGWNKYALINLEFGNQIICKKRIQ